MTWTGSFGCLKDVNLWLIAAALGGMTISLALVVPSVLRHPADSVAAGEWRHVCHGAVVFMSLATDGRWVTNRTYKITFLFSVENISGCPNRTIYYDNSHVILNSVRIDPSYLDLTASPFQNLSERQAWSVDWYVTPKGDDYTLSCLGISQGREVQYSLSLEVKYTVVDSHGKEWQGLFQHTPSEPCLTVTIVGGENAP